MPKVRCLPDEFNCSSYSSYAQVNFRPEADEGLGRTMIGAAVCEISRGMPKALGSTGYVQSHWNLKKKTQGRNS